MRSIPRRVQIVLLFVQLVRHVVCQEKSEPKIASGTFKQRRGIRTEPHCGIARAQQLRMSLEVSQKQMLVVPRHLSFAILGDLCGHVLTAEAAERRQEDF